MNFKVATICCTLLIIVSISTTLATLASQRHHDAEVVHLRQKRASPDFFGKIKSSITASIGKASASSAGASSGTSSSKTFAEKPPEKEIYFDGWELKKSILNTLFQAVKAITGGVTAIKGQLIKGSGYALSHGGKLIAASGDAVTNVGKKIALSAKLLPPEKPHFPKFFGSSGHTAPTGEDFTSFAQDDIIEFAQPHDIPVFAPEPHIPYLPVDVAYDNHIPTPHYGPPSLLDAAHAHSHITNYISTERKEQEQHYDKLDIPPVTGPDTEDALSTHEANQKAIEALQLILRKLPLPKKIPSQDHLNTIPIIDDHENDNLQDIKLPPPTQFEQFTIPKDPSVHIPQFKPIKSSISSTYKVQIGPYESVAKHTISGLLYVANDHIATPSGPKPKICMQPPFKSYAPKSSLIPPRKEFPSTFQKHPAPHQQSHIHSHAVNAPPLDLYHTMTLKNGGGYSKHSPQPLVFITTSSPIQSHSQSLPAQQPPQHTPQFEIHKSVEYQLQ